MRRLSVACVILIVIGVGFFARPLFQGRLPIPADTIVGLYYPFRDNFEAAFPRGVPFKNFLITDPVRQTFPWRNLSIQSEKSLRLPLWNPYEMAGYPLLANLQSAAFYPLNIIFYVLPFALSWSFLIILQPCLAGIFLYAFLRNKNLHPLSALFGALSFAFSGFMTTWLEWGTVGQVALWLPLILLSIDKIVLPQRKKPLLWYAVFMAALSCSFLGGHLQTFFYLFILSFAYLIFQWFRRGRDTKALVSFVVCYVLFGVITAVQWIPFTQFLLHSGRSVDLLNNWKHAGWFIPWQQAVQFLAPDFFGNPTTLNYWGVWNYGEFTGYVGVIPLLLACFAVLSRRTKEVLFFLASLLVALLFAFPTPLAKLPYLYAIPFFSTAQPTRLLFIIDFVLAVLGAYGLEGLLARKDKKIALVVIAFCLFFGFLWLFVLGKLPGAHIAGQYLLVARHNLYLPTLLFALFVIGIVAIFFLPKKLTVLIVVILLIATAGDLFRFAGKFNPFTDATYLFPNTKVMTYLKKHAGESRIMATDPQILPPNFASMYKLQSIDGYDPLYLLRYGEYAITIRRGKPDITTPFGFNRIITLQNPSSRLIDLLGVKYVLSLTTLADPKLEKQYTFGQTTVYQNKDAYPRTFFVKDVRSENAKKAVLRDLYDTSISLKDTAIVEDYNTASQTAFATGSAAIVRYGADRVTIKTKNKKSGFLVLTDAYYPTWQVSICDESFHDCSPGVIYRTDYLFRGVMVPAGSHIIVFSDKLL